MEKEVAKHHHSYNHNSSITTTTTTTTNLRERHIIGESLIKPPQSADFVLRWGNQKRLRCMKIQVKDETAPVHRTTARVDRRVVRSDNNNSTNAVNGGSGHFNLRQRAASPAQPPQRILRNSENGSAMKGHNHHSNGGGGVRGLASPDRGEKKGTGVHHNSNNNNHESNNINNGMSRTASSDKAGSSSGGGGGGGSEVVVWPPKFMIALTNKEKEEDFMAIKGSKLPQRPKKRAKFVQRTLNLVSPGGWLCDLTLERYEVREKKISKKRPRGLKAMGNYMDSDSD